MLLYIISSDNIDFAYYTKYVELHFPLEIILVYNIFIPLRLTSLHFILFQALISLKPGKVLSHFSLEFIHFSHQFPALVYPSLTFELFLVSLFPFLPCTITLWSPPH